MTDKTALLELLEAEVRGLGYELVDLDLRVGGDGLLRLYIDSEDGITLDDCERVSHQVSGLLDVEDPIPGHYTLEVSSPGVNRPLRTPGHFRRFEGERAKIELARSKVVLVESPPGHSEGVSRAEHRDVDAVQEIRQRADVVLVPMRDDDPDYAVGFVQQIVEIWDDVIDPQHVIFGEHDAGIHDQDIPAVFIRSHVLPHFP
jgi:ribosome maturation factor RimP